MGLFDRADAAAALEDLLDRERRAAIAGRFDILQRIEREKERLLDALGRSGAGAEALTRLGQKAERNRAILEAMGRGVRAAQAQIATAQNGPTELGTYTASGERRVLGSRPARPGRRA